MKRTVLLAALTAAIVSTAAPAHADPDLYGVEGDQLVGFGVADATWTTLPLVGLGADRVVAVDARWATGGLYGVTRAVPGDLLQVVRIDQSTGAVTPIGASMQPSGLPDGVGFDIDPVTDRALVVTSRDDAWEVDLGTAATVAVPGPDPASQEISALAYFPPDGPQQGAVSVDSFADVLRDGAVGGPSIGGFGQLNVSRNVSLDIGGDGLVYLETRVGSNNVVYTVSPATGRAASALVSPTAEMTAFAVRQTGRVSWAAPVQQAAEADGAATLTLVREAPASGPAVVRWATVNGTATAGADYNGASGLVTFGRGETTKTVTVPVVQDTAAEGPETVTLALSSDDGVAVGPAGVLRINDDDAVPGPGPGGTDTTRPVVVAVPLTLRPSRRIVVPFGLGEPAHLTATLTLSKRTAKKAGVKPLLSTVDLPSAAVGSGRLSFTLKRSVLRALPRTARATATLTATDAAGNTTTATAKITLKRA